MRTITTSRWNLVILSLFAVAWLRGWPTDGWAPIVGAETAASINALSAAIFALFASWHFLVWLYGAMLDFDEWAQRRDRL